MNDPRRRALRFTGVNDVINDVDALRRHRYTKLGNWSLEQICFHVGRPIATPIRSLASDPDPAASAALCERLRHYVDTGTPPPNAKAPPGSEPPADLAPDVVDDFVDRLRAAAAFRGEYVDFGPRGAVPRDMLVPFLLAHSAHHLSHLLPRSA